MGAGLGALFGHFRDKGIDQTFQQQVRDALQPGSTQPQTYTLLRRSAALEHRQHRAAGQPQLPLEYGLTVQRINQDGSPVQPAERAMFSPRDGSTG